MPFTFSHPAAVLPIHSRLKRWIPLSALVIGSLVPDAAYYLPLPEYFRLSSHTLLGTFSSSLPVGILLWLIFYWLAAPAAFLLPSPHREALGPQLTRRLTSVPQALSVVSGIMLGAWSHVLWDSFTHERGWIVRHAPLLQRALFGNMLPVYKALQYLSSLFGLWVLVYAYDKWMKASGVRQGMWPKPGWRIYLLLGISIICFAAAAIEAHAINSITSLLRQHRGHPSLEFFTTFVRNTLIVLCAVSIGAKVLGFGSARESNSETTPD
jgi:hypothetical protein